MREWTPRISGSSIRSTGRTGKTGKAGKTGSCWNLRATARAALALFAFLPVLPVLPVFPALSVLTAQTVRATGRVITADSTPVRGVRVILHRVGRAAQGPLDSARSDAQGRFRFSFRNDTTAIYLLSARYQGIEYFSPPVHTNPERPDTAIRIVVADTSSTAPVSLEARHLVVTQPGEDGSRSVLDLLVLRNAGKATRVAPDGVRPSWSGPLPHGTIGLEVGESDFSPDAVSRRDDSLILTAPLSPGDKQITVQYLLPSNQATVELPFQDSVSSVNVLTEERGARVTGGSLALADSQIIQGRAFRRWTGNVPAGGKVRVALPGVRHTPERLVALLVSVVVLVLGAAGWYRIRRRAPATRAASPEELVDAIATLDARYLGREGEVPAAEWSSYLEERARLKDLLEASLAAGRASP